MIDKEKNLVWIDLEMTGLGDEHVIIEIASLVTDSDLRELATGPVLAIHRTKEELENINEWSRDQHTKSGLIDRVKESSTTITFFPLRTDSTEFSLILTPKSLIF